MVGWGGGWGPKWQLMGDCQILANRVGGQVGGPTKQLKAWGPEPLPTFLEHAECNQMVSVARMCLPGALVMASTPGCRLDFCSFGSAATGPARAQPRGLGAHPTTCGVWGVHTKHYPSSPVPPCMPWGPHSAPLLGLGATVCRCPSYILAGAPEARHQGIWGYPIQQSCWK